MYRLAPSKKQLIRQVAIYALMTTTVIVAVFLLAMFVLGYRFDRSTGTIEQSGLVQLRSIPSGAAVSIGPNRLSGSTSTKATTPPGVHEVTMSRTGYHPWQKTVNVGGGSVLWLSYARLIPVELDPEVVVDLGGVTSTLPSPDRDKIAMTTDSASPAVTLVNVSRDSPSVNTLMLPPGSFTDSEGDSAGEYHIVSWNEAGRYLLMRHDYGSVSEWIMVDTEDIDETKNITTLFDIAITELQFSQGGDGVLIALVGDDIRRIDTRRETISAPLVRGVAEFSIFDRSTITYVTTADKQTGRRSVGYYTEGATEPRVIRSYSDDDSLARNHHISAGKYLNKTYVAISYGNTTDILSGSLPRSDSDSALSLSTVTTISLPAPVDYLSSRTNGRFFVMQHKNSYTVYDLELDYVTTTTVQGEGALRGELGWVDGYNVWSDLGGMLRLSEFDGANQHDIMPVVPGQSPVISINNRYLYAPTEDESGKFHLSRVRLVI